MKNMDHNTVISWGLSLMGLFAVVGWILISIKTGTSSGTEVPISIISGLVGVLTGKNLAENRIKEQSKTSQALEKVAETASAAQKAVDVVDTIKDIVKK